MKPIKVLLFSSLFPSSVRPIHGIFVETRLRELVKSGQVEAKVVAVLILGRLSHDQFCDPRIRRADHLLHQAAAFLSFRGAR